MLSADTKRSLDAARQMLVGQVPDPKGQVEQITTALLYKFMDERDRASQEDGGKPHFFTDELAKYSWRKILSTQLSGEERRKLYTEAIENLSRAPTLDEVFRTMFRGAFLSFQDARTLTLFLREIDRLPCAHSEELGNGYEYLLSIMGTQGNAGQFRTPRNIIDFIVAAVDPQKNERILDPACGTAGFLISAYNHILTHNQKHKRGDLLSPADSRKLAGNLHGYEIDPGMTRLSRVNMFLHNIRRPQIFDYDALSREDKWDEDYQVVLANPPFMSPKGGINPHRRFAVQANRSEVLFVDYIAEHLMINGRAGVIVPEGIIFKTERAYKKLRQKLLEDWGLFSVVSLPTGVFNPYSGVKTSILLMDKKRASQNGELLFINVKNDGFGLGAKRRSIGENDLPQALDILQNWRQGKKVSSDLALWVEKEKIAASGDYNLVGDKYREVEDYANAKYPMVALGKVCELIRGVTYSKNDEVEKNGLKVLRANNINLNGSLNLHDIKIISSDLKLSESKKLNKGDIFICLASGSKSHIGKVAYIKDNTNFYFGGFMGAIRINQKGQTIPQYIFYQLKSSKFNIFLRKEISGVNINNLNSKILSRYKIPLPPLEVQKQIVAEIDGYQKIIDGAKQVIDNWMPRIAINPDWEMVALGEICEIYQPKTITLKQLKDWGKYKVFGANGVIGFFDKYNHEDSEVAITCRGATCGAVNFTEPQSWITGNAMVTKPEDAKLSKEYLFYLLKSSNLNSTISGTAQPQITISNLSRHKIPVPPIEVQKQIVAEIEKEETAITQCKMLIETYEQKIKGKIAEVWSKK